MSENYSASTAELLLLGRTASVTRGGANLQRILDLTVALVAIVVLAPLMAVIALAIWLSDGGPMFFGHDRVGRMGRTFRCWKFRSMTPNADEVLRQHLARDGHARSEWESSQKLRNDPRITPVGRLLRASSLDELPQLWNVIVGEMSVVGPRPIVPAEILRYRAHFADYCTCRPGITGLWQVSGRNDVSYDQRVALDVRYARTRTIWLDLVIIASTIPAVLARRGSY